GIPTINAKSDEIPDKVAKRALRACPLDRKIPMRFRRILCAVLLSSFASRSAQANPEVPGAPQDKPIALVGGIIHPVSGPAIEGGTLLFDKGKIVALGRDVAIPDGAQRVEVPGKHVYPGLIDANSQLGLVEVPSV